MKDYVKEILGRTLQSLNAPDTQRNRSRLYQVLKAVAAVAQEPEHEEQIWISGKEVGEMVGRSPEWARKNKDVLVCSKMGPNAASRMLYLKQSVIDFINGRVK